MNGMRVRGTGTPTPWVVKNVHIIYDLRYLIITVINDIFTGNISCIMYIVCNILLYFYEKIRYEYDRKCRKP